ncbi:MAG: GNAT family N-acetyltransferase [Chloroflexi bacterium]|nr:GNAT family N-acetyltransferase [Chloroflexota bacterium]
MVIVRAARPDDADGLNAVIQAVDAFHADGVPHVFRRFDGPARSAEWFADALNNPDSLLLVATNDTADSTADSTADGAIVGFLSALVRQNPDLPMFVPRRWLLVDAVGVLEAYRGQGVGRALMEQAHAWAQAQGLAEVELTVWEFNQGAIAFYAELGYTTVLRRLWKPLR